MPELGKALSALLDHAGSPDAAAREIANTPELIAEARAALPALQFAATAKAGHDGVRKVLAKRFELYPQPARTNEGWDAWFADYFDALEDLSLASLEAGMRAYVLMPDSEFMPKPGKLRELSHTTPCRSLLRYYRAKQAVALADHPPALEGPRADPAEVRALLAEFQAKIGDRTPEKPKLPSIAGKVDGGGLTAQMRELMARQQEPRP